MIILFLFNRYDFAQVSKWFAERSDLILLLFDSYKLDISDEFKGIIENLRSFDDKVHCVMNKADQLDPESLMKVSFIYFILFYFVFKNNTIVHFYFI